MLRLLFAAAVCLTLAACGGEGASAPGGVSPGEAKALDDAAAMLDQRRLPPEALATPGAISEPARSEMTGDAALRRP